MDSTFHTGYCRTKPTPSPGSHYRIYSEGGQISAPSERMTWPQRKLRAKIRSLNSIHDPRTHLINRGDGCAVAETGASGKAARESGQLLLKCIDSTREHSRQGSVTEEQRSQRPVPQQPEGLPVFGAGAALRVSRRSVRIFSLPRALPQPQNPWQRTRPPIYEWVSSFLVSSSITRPTPCKAYSVP